MNVLTLYLPVAALLAACDVPERSGNAVAAGDGPLLTFLRSHIAHRSGSQDTTVHVQIGSADLDGDSIEEAIVYAYGNSECGSGGCNTYILQRSGEAYRLVTQLTISWPPIRVLETRSNGWRNLTVWMRDGVSPAYESELRFDGASYPRNPSVAPAQPLRRQVKGEVLIPAEPQGIPLYRR